MIGVTAFHTDFLQSHVCGCKITAGGVDSLSSDIVTDTHALFLFKEGTQISRADIGFEEMIALDLDYVRRVSMGTDFRILLSTFRAVLGGKGAY